MKNNWFVLNTDKLILYSLVILGGIFMMHILHHGKPDVDLLSWLENSFSTVLGALILLLTGRDRQRSADQPGGNGAQAKPRENNGPAAVVVPIDKHQ